MPDDSSLAVTITADAGGATDQLSRVSAALDAIVQNMATTKAGGADMGTTLVAAHTEAASAAREHAVAETILGESISKVEGATATAARMFSALGFETGAATERVEVFGEALDGLGKAAGPLLVIGAAVLGIAAAFEFVTHGIDEAAKAQMDFASLGVAVKNQGGDWEAARGGVEKFLDAIEGATTYSRGEALEALNHLVTAGMNLSDAEKSVAIATDVAAASHKSLLEVTDALVAAHAGHGRALVALDANLKTLNETGAKYSAFLNKLGHDDYGAAEAAAESFRGRQEQLGNAIAHVGEEIGTLLLPALTTGAELLLGFAREAEEGEPKVAAFFDTVVNDAEHATRVLSDMAKMAKLGIDTVTGNGAALLDDAKGGTDAAKDLFKVGAADFGGPNPGAAPSNPISDWINHARVQAAKDEKEWNAELDAWKRKQLQDDFNVARDPRPKRERADSAPQEVQLIGADDSARSGNDTAYKTQQADLKALVASEGEFREAEKLTTNADDERIAKMALANKETVDATVSINILTTSIASEKAALVEATAEQTRHAEAAKALQEAHDRLAQSVNASRHETKEQAEELKDLKAAYELHNKAANDAKAVVASLTSEIESNSSALETQKQKIDAVAAAYAQQTRAMGEAFAKDLEQQQAEDKKREVQQAGVAEENALYGLSLAQQLEFYRQRFANDVAAGNQYTDQAKADWSKIISLEGDVYKQRLEEQRAFIASAQSLEAAFIGDVLTKHQSLRDSLKDIFKSIAGDFEQMIEQMIVKSSLFNGLNASLEKVFNVGGGAGTGGAGASLPGLGGIFGGGGSTGTSPSIASASIFTGNDSPGQNSIVDIGSSSLTAMSSAPGVNGNGTPDFGNAGGGGSDWGNAGPSFGSVAGSGLTGFGLGNLAASVTGGNAMYGGILGGIGGIAASVGGLTGPAGLGVSLAAGLLGSLFTGAQPTAAKDPDEFEGQTGYGQDVADLQFGQANANGTFYYPDAAIAKFVAAMGVAPGSINQGANQGMQAVNSNGTIASSGGIDAAEMWLSQNSKDTSAQLEAMGVSPAEFANWVSLLGESATGSGQYTHYDKNVGDIEVTGAGIGGNTKSTTAQMAAALQSIITASGNDSSSTSSVFTVGRTYPNWNNGVLQPDGTYTQTGVAPGGTGSTSTTPGKTTVGTGNASSDAMNGAPIAGGPEIHNHFTITLDGAKFFTTNDIQATTDQLAKAMSQSLSRFGLGQLAGGIAARSTRSGNF